MHHLILATRNAHKTREFAQILGAEFDVRDLASALDVASVEETGLTFAENAILKAVAISKQFPELVVADDSGLEVDALAGAPGIYSARYAGAGASDAENVAKLLAELARCNASSRGARFRCALALASATGRARFNRCGLRCFPDRARRPQGFGGGGGAAGPGGGTVPVLPVGEAALIW